MKLKSLALFGAMTLFAALGIAVQTFAQGPIFAPVITYGSGGSEAYSVAVADVNGDGKPDLVVANACEICENGTVGVLLGNGDGSFQSAVIYDSGGFSATSVAIADVNREGESDLVVANRCVSSGTDCGATSNGSVGVLINVTPSPYKASVQQPINPDGGSIFNAKRGVIPVKFTLTQNGTQTCALPPATISVTRTAGGTPGAIDEASYLSPADNGSNFKIADCQYIYNLASNSLGVGAYRVDISINGQVVGSGLFALMSGKTPVRKWDDKDLADLKKDFSRGLPD